MKRLLINNISKKAFTFFSAKNICGKSVAFATIFAAALLMNTLPLAAQEKSNAATKTYSFFVTAGPMLMVNTSSSTDSAPSPVMFSCGFGATLFQDRMFQFQPRISFFTNYYLWNNDMALPAEVENRTATALSFMFDLPAVHTWQNGKNEFQAGAGLGFLARIGILSNGVSGSDENRDDSTRDATQDVKDINSWFWSDMRFLYPELCGSWTYTTPSGWKVGAEARLYLPLGSLITGRGLDATIISLAAKINTK